tara:strand:- start:164 stop:1051 length:888 start_codon:yes stop_codon:yes gene_type:complete
MPTIVNAPLKSKYGFESNGFIVDDEGNIFAKSIALVDVGEEVVDPGLPADFDIVESGGNFRLSGGITDNPTITVFRTKTTTIDLTLSSLVFNIVTDDKTTLYSTVLSHVGGDSGDAAQGKQTGRLSWTIPVSAPNTLYYANIDGTIFGTITVSNAPSAFSEVSVTGNVVSTSSTTGSLVVTGGAGISGDLYIGGSLNIDGVGITSISSSTNLEFNANNKIILQIDNIKLGELNSTGLAIPINNSTINNTTIGATTPATGAFTSATVEGAPTIDRSVPNKQYVDSTALSLAIAFGL